MDQGQRLGQRDAAATSERPPDRAWQSRPTDSQSGNRGFDPVGVLAVCEEQRGAGVPDGRRAHSGACYICCPLGRRGVKLEGREGILSPFIVGGIVGGAFTVLLWCLTAFREHQLNKKRERADQQRDLRTAISNYLAALDSWMDLVLAHPPDNATTLRMRRKLVASAERILGPLAVFPLWLARLMVFAAWGTRMDKLRDQYLRARIELALIAPSLILDVMEEVSTFLSQDAYDEEWRCRWPTLRTELLDRMRAGLGKADAS